MTIRKFLNYWFGKTREGFYFFLALLLVLCYLSALVIEEYQLTSRAGILPGQLKAVSFAGTLLLSLLVLAHSNLHACHEFLHLFQKQGHLPRKQIEHVNSFCMTVFLAFSLLCMVLFALFLDPLWSVFLTWFRNLSHPVSQPAPPAKMEHFEAFQAPDLTKLLAEASAPPAWMEVLNHMFEILGYILVILVLCFLFRTVCLMVWHWITKPRHFDDDEKIYLRPTVLLPADKPQKSPEHREQGIRYYLSYNGKIRRLYRKRILSHSRNVSADMAHFFWASPSELEHVSGLEDQELHQLYEKARYGPEECTESDWKKLRS